MEITITTPALLFPAISLLLLAFTNRFLVLAQLIRELRKSVGDTRDELILKQIDNLKIRLRLIRRMQLFGVLAFLFCTISMFSLFMKGILIGEILFGVSLLSLLTSLILSFLEVSISTKALRYELSDLAGEM